MAQALTALAPLAMLTAASGEAEASVTEGLSPAVLEAVQSLGPQSGSLEAGLLGRAFDSLALFDPGSPQSWALACLWLGYLAIGAVTAQGLLALGLRCLRAAGAGSGGPCRPQEAWPSARTAQARTHAPCSAGGAQSPAVRAQATRAAQSTAGLPWAGSLAAAHSRRCSALALPRARETEVLAGARPHFCLVGFAAPGLRPASEPCARRVSPHPGQVRRDPPSPSGEVTRVEGATGEARGELPGADGAPGS